MLQTRTLGYSDVVVPTSIVQAVINYQLIDNGGNVAGGVNLTYGTTSAAMNVPSGTGWKFRALNKATDGSTIGAIVESEAFDVDEGHTINIVTNISIVP